DQVPRDRRWMREEPHAASREWAAQFGFVEESIDAKLHIFPEPAPIARMQIHPSGGNRACLAGVGPPNSTAYHCPLPLQQPPPAWYAALRLRPRSTEAGR